MPEGNTRDPWEAFCPGPNVSASLSSLSDQPDDVVNEDTETGAESPALCSLVIRFDLILYLEHLLLDDEQEDGAGDEKCPLLFVKLHSPKSFPVDTTSPMGNRERSLATEEQLCPRLFSTEPRPLDGDRDCATFLLRAALDSWQLLSSRPDLHDAGASAQRREEDPVPTCSRSMDEGHCRWTGLEIRGECRYSDGEMKTADADF